MRQKSSFAVAANSVSASLAGLGLSWALDWPSGACVALLLCAVGIAAALGRAREARAG